MKKILFVAAAALMSLSAWAQSSESFKREMPCKNDFGQVIAQKMGTICLPYAAKPVDCSVYRLASASATEWVFVQVLNMEPNTPYVFVVENNATLEASFERCGENVECDAPCGEAAGVANAFVGSYQRKVIRGKQLYFLSGDKINSNEGTPVLSTPNRAYFSADVMPAGQTLADDVKLTFIQANTTRIERLENEGATSSDAVVESQNIGLKAGEYKLNGKRTIVK